MCDHCDNPSRAKLCPCREVAYCSEDCALAAWEQQHAAVCSFTPTAIDAQRPDERMQTLFELLQDANQPESEYKNLFSRVYPPQRYNYVITHYDRCQKPIMLLDSRGDVSVAVLSSIQRLWRDYFGPWTGARMALLKLPPGFGKTAMGHLLWANYKYEAVTLPEVPSETSGGYIGPTLLPRIPIWITRPTLIHTVSEDLWAQDDRNPTEIKAKIRENGGEVNERGIDFNKNRLVMSYAQFENLLQGRSAAGRKLWAGLRLTDSTAVSAMETYNGVPTAYRQDAEGRWVRGNASHEIDNTTELRNLELRFVKRLEPGKLDTIRNIIAKDFDPLINQWKRYTWTVKTADGEKKRALPLVLRKAIKNIAAVESIGNNTLMITVRWKSRDNLPSVELWERWVEDGFNPFTAYRNLTKHYTGELKAFGIHTELTTAPTRGWKLGRVVRGMHASRAGTERLSWVPVQSDEREVDFNPLDRLMLIIDEAHNIYGSDLLRAALKDSKNVVVVNMSASIDLFTGLRLLDNSLPSRENPEPTALGPARNFPTDLPQLSADAVRTYDELKTALTPKYFDPEANDFTPTFGELSNAFKGVISVANISEMRDIFAEAVYPKDQQLEVRLSIAHARQVQDLFMQAITQPENAKEPLRHQLPEWVQPAQNAISLYNPDGEAAPLDLHDRYNLASKTFRKEAATVANTLIYGHSPIFPAAKVVLQKLRQLDEQEWAKTGQLTKRMLVSSTEDHKYGVIPMATSMQAAGYEWLPVELQQPDLAKLSTRARNRLRENRRLGVKIDSTLRKVKSAEEPLRLHSEGVEEKYQPFSEQKQFVVLSEELINRLLLASVEDPTFDSIVQDALDEEPPSLKTAYKFHSTKGQMRERSGDEDEVFEPFATDDAERQPHVEELLNRIMGKRLYIWPGYREEMNDWKSLQSEQMKVLLQIEDPQPFFFVRTQRSIIKLGREIEELNIPDEEEQLVLRWPRDNFNPVDKRNRADFEVLLGWLEPAKTLGDDTKKDAQDTILEVFNDMNNIRGTNVRFILLGEGFLEGINVKAATKVIELEPAVTYTSSLQRRGRAIRRCGHEGLPFDQWRVEFYTVVHRMPEQDLKFEAQLFADETDDSWPVEIDEAPTQRAPKDESPEAKKQRLAESRARTKQESAVRQFAYRQLSVLSSIGAEPVDWKTTPVKGRLVRGERSGATPILDTDTRLEPYEAVRMLHEDPRVTLVRLRGEQLLDELAVDRGHNVLRTQTTSTVRLNTNYMLRTGALAELIVQLEAELKRRSDTSVLREQHDGLVELLGVINDSKAVPLIHREIADRDDAKTLYLLLKNRTFELRASLFGVPTTVSPVEQLRWLVKHNYAQWATVVDPAGSSSPAAEESVEGEEILVGSGIEDIGIPDEEQEEIELATMTNVFRILYVLGIEWKQETTSLLWPEAEQPDPDVALGQVRPHNATTPELKQKLKSVLEQLFADDGDSVRSVPSKRVVKRALLDVYRYGLMNWYRGAALLAHVLRIRDNDAYWGNRVFDTGDQASKALTEAQLKRAATLTGALFRLASAPDLTLYLERLRRLAVARHDNDFDQKAAIILASARWFDEIVIKRKAAEVSTRQGALGRPLYELADLLEEMQQQLGINLNLHIDAVLGPLLRAPKAQLAFPTTLAELEQQIRRTKPRPDLTTDIKWLVSANRLFELYIKYGGNLTETLEELSTDLAKRNTVLRALNLPLPPNNNPENVDQQIETTVEQNLAAIKQQWPESEPYSANIIAAALLRTFRVKRHWTANPSNPRKQDKHAQTLRTFLTDATEALGKKTLEMSKFLRDQKEQKAADELLKLQNRPTRLTGFNTAQRVLNKTDGVGLERTERKATDLVPLVDGKPESVPLEELLDEPEERTNTLLLRIDPALASEHNIRGGLLQSLTETQSSITNLPEMYVEDLVLYAGTAPLESRFFTSLTKGVQDRVETESRKQLAEGFTASGVKALVKELLRPDNAELLRDIFLNRPAASFLELLQFADVGKLEKGMLILEQHRRLTDAFIREFDGTTPVSTLAKRLDLFCAGCNLDDIKHVLVDPALYRNYPYYTQVEWDELNPSTSDKKSKSKKDDPATLRSNANVLRIAVILYSEKTAKGKYYGSYHSHVSAIRRTVGKVEPELIHEKIPGQTMISNPAFVEAGTVIRSRVVFAAFEETIRERGEKFKQDYKQ